MRPRSVRLAREAMPLPAEDAPVIECHDLSVGYAGHPVVRNIDLYAKRGEVVALLGRNGAGKTTLLKTLAGLLSPIAGEYKIAGSRPAAAFYARVRDGLGFVTEDRAITRRLTVAENLRLGRGSVGDALARFPELEKLQDRPAGLLSGGEQQMLALGKLLSARPSLLLIDELSLGLAPLVVERLMAEVRRAASEDGAAILLVEQQPVTALTVAGRAYVVHAGRIRLSGDAADLSNRFAEIEALYMADS